MPGPTPAFVLQANIPGDSAVEAGDKWVWSCGMEMVDQSVRGRDNAANRGGRPAALKSAHQLHHDGDDTLFVSAGNHDPTASFYFTEGVAWCSCGYDPDTDALPE